VLLSDRRRFLHSDAARAKKARTRWLIPSKSNGNCVPVLHGIADSRAGSIGFAPMFLNEGYAVLLPDSRAHGASGGQLVTYQPVVKVRISLPDM
jgi:alpha-beta hydrolase superfamily lysophospholipase